MLVFISWSGARSKAVAEAVSTWLSKVIQAVEPWISIDIEKGVRWSPDIAAKLEKSKVGIICLTKDNLDSRWILFEAGALSKTEDANVCTFLTNLKPADIEHPLAQFQHTLYEKDDLYSLVQSINRKVLEAGEKALNDKTLGEIFEVYWPELDSKLRKAISLEVPELGTKKSDNELLQDILEGIRGSERWQLRVEKMLSDRIVQELVAKVLGIIREGFPQKKTINSLIEYDKFTNISSLADALKIPTPQQPTEEDKKKE